MKYCPSCGTGIEPKTKKCPNCNAEIVDYEKLSREGLIFAIISIFAWIIPLFGLLTSIPGLINCSKVRKKEEYKKKGTIGFSISIITLALTIANIIIPAIKEISLIK